jgi:Ca2+/H+ antiporter
MSQMTSMVEPQVANVADRSRQTSSHNLPTRRNPFTLRLWLPLTPVWIFLAPFAVLAAPLLTLVPATRTIAPYRAAFAAGAVLLSLSGTVVEVNSDTAVIHIRIF